MDIQTSLQAIDYMIRVNPDSEEYTVAFFGGEPFLEFAMIEQIVEMTLNKYSQKTFHFTATTNGTILNKRILSFLKKYNFTLMISLDGPQELTNKLRPHINPRKETFTTIMKNVSILKKESINIEFRATIVAGESDLLSISNFFENQKVPYHLSFCFETQNRTQNYSSWQNENIAKLSCDFDMLFKFYYDLMLNKHFIWGFYFLENLRAIALRMRNHYPCGAGINMFAVTNTGDIFSCMNYTPISHTKIGNIGTGVMPSLNSLYKAKPVQRTKECNNCNTRFFCSGGCVAERYAVNKNTSTPAPLHCALERLLFEKYLSSYQFIKNNLPETMNNIIKHKQLYEN